LIIVDVIQTIEKHPAYDMGPSLEGRSTGLGMKLSYPLGLDS